MASPRSQVLWTEGLAPLSEEFPDPRSSSSSNGDRIPSSFRARREGEGGPTSGTTKSFRTS